MYGHIPNKESDPELYNLVTRYQMHKVVAIASAKESVVMCLLPDVNSVFHGYLVRAPS